jgi:hypothetical protein
MGPGQGQVDFTGRLLQSVDVGVQEVGPAIVGPQQVENADAAQNGQVINRNDRLFSRNKLTVHIICCHNILPMIGFNRLQA